MWVLRASIHSSRETILCGCMICSSVGWVSGEIFFKLVERTDPAALMAVARCLIEQLLVQKREQRAVTVGLQRDGHLRFAFRRRMPAQAEHQPLVRHHFAINPADFVVFVIGRKADAKTPPDPRLDVRAERAGLGVGATEPSDYFLRVGPCRVDFRRRGIETTFETEARPGDGRASSARRVGSASAAKVRSSVSSRYLTIWFSIGASEKESSRSREIYSS